MIWISIRRIVNRYKRRRPVEWLVAFVVGGVNNLRAPLDSDAVAICVIGKFCCLAINNMITREKIFRKTHDN